MLEDDELESIPNWRTYEGFCILNVYKRDDGISADISFMLSDGTETEDDPAPKCVSILSKQEYETIEEAFEHFESFHELGWFDVASTAYILDNNDELQEEVNWHDHLSAIRQKERGLLQ